VAGSKHEGLIFTYVWAFDQQEDWDFVDETCEIFASQGATIYFVELEADLEEGLDRNKNPHRLEHKPTKRNVEWSENELKESMRKYRLNSKQVRTIILYVCSSSIGRFNRIKVMP